MTIEISRHTTLLRCLNTLRPRRNGRHFPNGIFKCIFVNENSWISIMISLKFVPKNRIDNRPTLVQIMAWHRPGDKPSSEPMVANLLTHILDLPNSPLGGLRPSFHDQYSYIDFSNILLLCIILLCCKGAGVYYIRPCVILALYYC